MAKFSLPGAGGLLLLTVVSINVPWHYIGSGCPNTLRGPTTDMRKNSSTIFVAVLSFHVFRQPVSRLDHHLAVKLGLERPSGAAGDVRRVCRAGGMLVPAAFQPRGPCATGLLLLVAFGSLGVAPIYYSFNQEMSGRNQGKVGGSLSFLLVADSGSDARDDRGAGEGRSDDPPLSVRRRGHVAPDRLCRPGAVLGQAADPSTPHADRRAGDVSPWLVRGRASVTQHESVCVVDRRQKFGYNCPDA